MHEQETVAPNEEVKTAKSASAPVEYDSNPFTAAWSGVQKLVHTNAQTVVGVAFFNILLFALTGVTAIILVLAIAAFVFKHTPDLQGYITDGNIMSFLNSLSDTSIYLTWIIGLAVCVFLAALTQSLQLNLTVAAAKNKSLKFGELLKASVRSVVPILGFISLIILTILAAIMLVGLLSTILGIITFLLGVVTMLAVIYIGIRLSYATYSIVDLKLGPIAAAKHSWSISKGHVIETIGSGAVAWLVLAIPSIIVQALARVTEGAPMLSGVFGIIDMALLVVLVIGAAMSVAERYVQLQVVTAKQTVSPKLSPFNYLAILLVIFLAPILNALSPKLETNSDRTLPGLYDAGLPTGGADEPIYRVN